MNEIAILAMLALAVVGTIASWLITRAPPKMRKRRSDGDGGGDAGSWSDDCAPDGDGDSGGDRHLSAIPKS
jgi:hypothetical protein